MDTTDRITFVANVIGDNWVPAPSIFSQSANGHNIVSHSLHPRLRTHHVHPMDGRCQPAMATVYYYINVKKLNSLNIVLEAKSHV